MALQAKIRRKCNIGMPHCCLPQSKKKLWLINSTDGLEQFLGHPLKHHACCWTLILTCMYQKLLYRAIKLKVLSHPAIPYSTIYSIFSCIVPVREAKQRKHYFDLLQSPPTPEKETLMTIEIKSKNKMWNTCSAPDGKIAIVGYYEFVAQHFHKVSKSSKNV